ncbi:MAG: hypothetical protein WBF93_18960, partial [Pirellulales bacterium]
VIAGVKVLHQLFDIGFVVADFINVRHEIAPSGLSLAGRKRFRAGEVSRGTCVGELVAAYI